LILDVGCGVHPKGDVNCDARKLCGIKNYVRCDANYLPFKSQAFDVVCAFNLLEHVDEPSVVIAECCRVGRKTKFSVDSLLNPLNYLHPDHKWLTFVVKHSIFFLARPRLLSFFSKWFYKCVYGSQSVYKEFDGDRNFCFDSWLIKRHITWFNDEHHVVRVR